MIVLNKKIVCTDLIVICLNFNTLITYLCPITCFYLHLYNSLTFAGFLYNSLTIAQFLINSVRLCSKRKTNQSIMTKVVCALLLIFVMAFVTQVAYVSDDVSFPIQSATINIY